jgi:rhodanese-related sulfurtransferase
MGKFYGVIVFLLIGAGVLFAVNRQSSTPQVSPSAQTNQLRFSAISREVSAGSAVLLDVRTAEEFSAGHFVGATNHSLQTMQAGTYPDVAKDKKIYVYCHSGNRSGQATTLLKSAGYTNITDLHGLSDVEAIGGKLTQ